jgi:predicted aspartyl protease
VREQRIQVARSATFSNSNKMKLYHALSLCVFCILPQAALSQEQSAANPVPGASGDHGFTIHIVRDTQKHLFIPVTINGLTSWWGVDTGFMFSIIDPAIATRAHLQRATDANHVPFNARVNGQICPIVTVGDLRSGSLSFGKAQIPVFEIESKRYEKSPEVGSSFEMGGILGMDFLSRFHAIIDFDRQEIALSLTGSALPAGAADSGYTHVALQRVNGRRLEVSCRLGTTSSLFLVDTGAPGTSCPVHVAVQNRIQLRRKPFTETLIGGGPNRAFTGRVNDFKIGNFSCGNTDLNFADLSLKRSYSGQLPEYLLGVDLLWKHRAILDIDRNLLQLSQSRR